MPPVNRKAWNEDLVEALKARHQQAWQQKKKAQYMWKDGADTIASVRKNISITKTGKIFNLPAPSMKKLTKTVYEECRKIITGERPLYPPGYVPLNPHEMQQLEESAIAIPYLDNIKKNGGAYAILLAFHFSGRDSMTKDQIIRNAQPYCDDAMEANFHEGRMYGAWKAKDTLVRHDLITEHRAGARYTQNGFRSNGCNSYSITPTGKRFITGLLEKFPDAKIPKNGRLNDDYDRDPAYDDPSESAIWDALGGRPPSAGRQRHRTATSTAKPHAKSADDERELRQWVASASVGQQLEQKVGKQRRLWLHRACDAMMEEQPGLRLKHESVGAGRDRPLFITVLAKPSGSMLKASPPRSLSGSAMSSPFRSDPASLFSSFSPSSSNKKRPAAAMFSGAGHRLSGSAYESTSTGRNNVAAKEAAARAAMARFASTQKKAPPSQNSDVVDLLSDNDDSNDNNTKPRARPKKAARTTEVICLDLDDPRPKKKAPPVASLKNHDDSHDDDDVINLDESQESVLFMGTSGLKTDDSLAGDTTPTVAGSSSELVTILIDDRERSRNITPRELRIELTKQIKSGALMSVWPKSMPKGQVQERHLVCGDFAFEVSTQSSGHPSSLSVVVERKRVADLIQRSAGSDHWKQLQRMRDSHEHAIMLIENDTRLAAVFDAYGAQHDPKPSHHLIENETDIFRFIGRAILSSRAIKFIQTRDNRGTFRSIGALALMATTAPKVGRISPDTSPPTVASEQQTLRDRLTSGGVHWKIAKEIANEVGSVAAMDALYNTCSSLVCQKALFRPFIDNMGEREDCSGSAEMWSAAVYHSYFSSTSARSEKSASFLELKEVVSDPAVLLSSLYTEDSTDGALDKALSFVEESPSRRVVSIELESDFAKCFEKPTERSFYTLNVKDSDDDSEMAPVISMSTSCGKLSSNKLVIYVIEGKQLVGAVMDAIEDSSDFVGAARQAACALSTLCPCGQPSEGKDEDRRVILVRGLGPALDARARCEGYRDEAKVVSDMVMSSLMIDYDYVVLQAIRLKQEELEMMVQQLALSCFYYQLLTREG